MTLFDRIKNENPMFGEPNVTIVPFPKDFPEKGKYKTWDKSWNPLKELSDTPHYKGQPPIKFPLDATPFECFKNGYLRST